MLLHAWRRCTSIQSYLRELQNASARVHQCKIEARESGYLQIKKVCLRAIHPVRTCTYAPNSDVFGTVSIEKDLNGGFVHFYNQYLMWKQLQYSLEQGCAESDSRHAVDHRQIIQLCRSLNRVTIDGSLQYKNVVEDDHNWINLIKKAIYGMIHYPYISEQDINIDRIEVISCVASARSKPNCDHLSEIDFCIRGRICSTHCQQSCVLPKGSAAICNIFTPDVYLEEMDSIIRQSIDLENVKVDLSIRVE